MDLFRDILKSNIGSICIGGFILYLLLSGKFFRPVPVSGCSNVTNRYGLVSF